jgi:glutamine phosphoribosylpyrophosphate amidotransferase
MCGVNGLLLADPCLNASPELYEGLGLLQHRGQVFIFFLITKFKKTLTVY